MTIITDDFNLDPLKMRLKKKKINSRNKGNAFERKLCEILNTFFNTTDFSRSPGSGAFATTHKLPEHLMIRGDLITPQKFKWIIEAKCGYDKEGICSLFSKKSIMLDWLVKVNKESLLAGRHFMLLLHQSRQETIAFTKHMPTYMNYPRNHIVIYGIQDIGDIVICNFKDLLELNKPDMYNVWY